MEIISILLVIAAIAFVIFVIGGALAYVMFAVPAMRTAPPMTESDREVCRGLIRQHKAYPFLCRSSVRKGRCPCQPCPKRDDAKAAMLRK